MGLRVLRLLAMAMATTALLMAWPAPVSGQVIAGPLSCTTSLISSFAPCLNFMINNTASPTADCCRSLGELMKASSGCACLILTGSVPLGVPVNRSMAVTLPKACNNASVPLKCQDATTSAHTPAPGPVADAPGPIADAPAPSFLAPLPPVTPAAATPKPKAAAPAAAVEPTAIPPVSQGQTKPTVVPSATSMASAHVSAVPALVLLIAVAGATLV
ncbi:unnamed protein product [Urochloa humidicola]